MNKIAVIGLGKAGIPLACVIAEQNIPVIGLDVSTKRVEDINNKINPIPEEPGVSEIFDKHIGVNFEATTSYEKILKECNVFIVIVPLFIDDNKQPVFDNIDTVMNELSKGLKDDDLVVLETTVPVGTTRNRLKPILDKSGSDYMLAYSPERIMTGWSISRYREFPKVVAGLDEKATNKVFDVYSKFCTKADKVDTTETAEMIKVSEGVYRDVNIALANELFKLCEKYGIDFKQMREKANHQFVNIHQPGIGVGGHCIPVYPWFLINDNDVPLTKTARLMNDDMIHYWKNKVLKKIRWEKESWCNWNYIQKRCKRASLYKISSFH
ncbi:MAG: nucleotide sugar dehydrogenase [Pseudomonadota bacterium]